MMYYNPLKEMMEKALKASK
ncbi:hypothetical protein ELI_2624 [Eubacterium callanderi]|uniref:Uncharacterized protein n=1 Tax=Eubacterium callanderi TaxID=53442 RepID=E3GNB0_9FIRM|nr:hypothetical protein ELI_2624 [Eubacterium callanderi]